MYDIIGDVHGHAPLLQKMLLQLGYKKTASGYSHSERKAVFVGDFVNRGPEIRKTLRIIRSMVENENALAILGNHEINIIISHIRKKKNPVFSNDISEIKTIQEFREYPDEWKDQMKWLRSLPLFLELDRIRVVHACWSDQAVEYIKQNVPPGRIKKEIFRRIYKNQEPELAQNVSILTKGLQFKLPGDLKIINNKGVSPRSFRMRWWENPSGKTFEEMSFENKYQLPDYTIPLQILPKSLAYSDSSPIVFFGHYCRNNGPHIISNNICCIDSCINGSQSLLAYRWDGEDTLLTSRLIKVK